MARFAVGRKLLLGCLPALFLLLVLELAVRATGASERCSERARISDFLSCDPLLGHRVNPERKPWGKPLNEAGFRTHAFAPKAPGVTRILSLGDSCTFGVLRAVPIYHVREPYPQRLERMAAERLGPGNLEVLNAGQGGYNTWHGVMLLRTRLRGLEPDLITVRYGWNDMLAASSSFRLPQTRLGLAVQGVLLRTALYPFLQRIRIELNSMGQTTAERAAADRQLRTEWKPSIPLQDYRRNLRLIVDLGRAQGAEVWLMTATHNPSPDDEAQGRLFFSDHLSIERLAEIQRTYNDATREVASERGAPLVDVAALYRAHGDRPLFVPSDFAHPTQAGHELEAAALYERLVHEGVLRAPGSERREGPRPGA